MDKIYRLSFLYSCQGGLNPGGGMVGCGSARWLRVIFLTSTPILSRRENPASHSNRISSEYTVLQLQPARPNNLFSLECFVFIGYDRLRSQLRMDLRLQSIGLS